METCVVASPIGPRLPFCSLLRFFALDFDSKGSLHYQNLKHNQIWVTFHFEILLRENHHYLCLIITFFVGATKHFCVARLPTFF